MAIDLSLVPASHRDTVRSALDTAFAGERLVGLEPGPTGASGAVTFRVRRDDGDHLLRIEGDGLPGRNPHQYRNLQSAADAGIAPPVRLVDSDAGILLMEWIDARPLTDHPGGPTGLVSAIGELVARLQQLPTFPAHDDWAEVIGRMLEYAGTVGRIDAEIVERLAESYGRIRTAWPRDPADFVPAHNDPNASNLLFDGDRLWLIDWETSSPNDGLVDLAVAANQLAPDDALRDTLLTSWRGAPPDDLLRARLTLAQLSAQLFAGCAIALVTAGQGGEPITSLDAPTPDEFQALLLDGTLVIGSSETMTTFAMLVLAQFDLQTATPRFETALEVSTAG